MVRGMREGSPRVYLLVALALSCSRCFAMGLFGHLSHSSPPKGGLAGGVVRTGHKDSRNMNFAGGRKGACFVHGACTPPSIDDRAAAAVCRKPQTAGSISMRRVRGEATKMMVFLPKNEWQEDDLPDRLEPVEGFKDGDGADGAEEALRLKPSKRAKTALDLEEDEALELEEQRMERYEYYDPLFGNMARPTEVNEMLRPMGLEKHRLVLNPDEAFGSIFRYEGSLSDTIEIHKKAWTKVAEENNLPVPDSNEVMLAMSMPAENAVQRVLGWTTDWGETKRLAARRAEVFVEAWREHDHKLREGTVEWLEKLYKAKIPMCVVSNMDAKSIHHSIEHTGIGKYFEAYVTAEDEAETRTQLYLKASLKLNRPPNHCVCFDNDPEGISAAHDTSALCVSVLGEHKAWELSSSDLTVSSLDELTTYNVRKLFAEVGEGRIEDMLQLEEQPQTSRWGGGGPWGGAYEEDGDDPYVYAGNRR